MAVLGVAAGAVAAGVAAAVAHPGDDAAIAKLRRRLANQCTKLKSGPPPRLPQARHTNRAVGAPSKQNEGLDQQARSKGAAGFQVLGLAREERVRPRPTMMNAIFPVFRIRPQI